MANLKQKFIKPGRDFNYSEGVKVKATEAVYQDQVVYVDGSSGPFLTVSIADADAAGETNGRMLIAKHDIAAGSYGICLPWKLVRDFDTSGSAAVGDPVYISATTGTARASNLTFTAPTGSRQVIVGRVTIDNTAANGGAMMIWPAAPEENEAGGVVTPGASRVPAETLTFVVTFGNTTTDNSFTLAPFPIILTDAYIACGNGQAVGLIVKDHADAACLTCANTAASAAAVSRATAYVFGAADLAAGHTMKLTRGGTPRASDVAVITAIRA